MPYVEYRHTQGYWFRQTVLKAINYFWLVYAHTCNAVLCVNEHVYSVNACD